MRQTFTAARIMLTWWSISATLHDRYPTRPAGQVFRWPAIFLLVLSTSTLIACRGGAKIPADWTAYPEQAWPHEPVRDVEPRLQVLLHWDRVRSTHVAVRVTTENAPPVVWDPGGAYGLTKPEYGRRNDVILTAPPDLPTWWEYRARWLHEPYMLVFEWDVSPSRAESLRDVLLRGAAVGRDSPEFQTVRRPGFCNFAVCSYLRDYASPPISRDLGSYFLPDDLAKRLWGQKPDRVLRYAGPVDALPTVWLPSDKSSGDLTHNAISLRKN